MLYYLFRFLESYGIPGSAMWSFISFRSLLALIFGLIISMWFGEKYIKRMRRMHIGETARDSRGSSSLSPHSSPSSSSDVSATSIFSS